MSRQQWQEKMNEALNELEEIKRDKSPIGVNDIITKLSEWKCNDDKRLPGLSNEQPINYFTCPSIPIEQEVPTNTFYSQSKPWDEYEFDDIPNELCFDEQRMRRKRPYGRGMPYALQIFNKDYGFQRPRYGKNPYRGQGRNTRNNFDRKYNCYQEYTVRNQYESNHRWNDGNPRENAWKYERNSRNPQFQGSRPRNQKAWSALTQTSNSSNLRRKNTEYMTQ